MSRLIINIVDLPADEMEAAWRQSPHIETLPGMICLGNNGLNRLHPSDEDGFLSAEFWIFKVVDPSIGYRYCARMAWWDLTESARPTILEVREQHIRWIRFDLNHASPEIGEQAVLGGLEPMLGGQQTASHPMG